MYIRMHKSDSNKLYTIPKDSYLTKSQQSLTLLLERYRNFGQINNIYVFSTIAYVLHFRLAVPFRMFYLCSFFLHLLHYHSLLFYRFGLLYFAACYTCSCSFAAVLPFQLASPFAAALPCQFCLPFRLALSL